MIDIDNIKKKQARKIVRLFEEKTRATVTARIGPLGFPACGDFFLLAQQKEDELQEYIFGTSDLVKLGEMWGIVKDNGIKKTKHYCSICGRVQYQTPSGLMCKSKNGHGGAPSVNKKKAKKLKKEGNENEEV